MDTKRDACSIETIKRTKQITAASIRRNRKRLDALVEALESRTLASAVAPFVAHAHSRVMLPGIEVGNRATAPGQHKDPAPPPPLPPPTPPTYTIVELPNPYDIGQLYFYDVTYTLWGGGPLVSQGAQVGLTDCWAVADWKAMALANPAKLTESAWNDARGGWDVKLAAGGGPLKIYHIQDGFPWFSAHPTDHALWLGVLEKAYAAATTGYYSTALGPGWMTTATYALGWTADNAGIPTTDAAMESLIDYNKAHNIGMTIGTGSQTIYLVASHAYTILGYTVTANGVTYQLNNPWQTQDGGALPDSNPSDGVVSITLSQLTPDIYPAIVEAY